MAKISILIHGATGETGGDIVEGLLDDGSYEISVLVRPQSAEKPAVKALKPRGIKIVLADTAKQNAEDLAILVHGYDIILSAVAAEAQLEQLVLVDAAAKAGTKRFVPCGFTTISPPGGVMDLRNQKERVHERIWYHHVPYTVIDVGYWYQISWPEVPSGRLDYAKMLPNTTIYGDGDAPNILIDKRDIGRFVARILKDERTLNKRVFGCSEILTQNQIWAVIEEKTGEKIQTSHRSDEEAVAMMTEAKAALEADPTDITKQLTCFELQYAVSKYVRWDNTPENAKYLGYLDARELYPDLKPISFAAFVDDLLAGKAKMLYVSKYAEIKASLEVAS